LGTPDIDARIILLKVDQILGNDSEISNYTEAVTKKQLRNHIPFAIIKLQREERAFCTRVVPRYYKQDELSGEQRGWETSPTGSR
jgi:hypothetical protein